MTVNNTSKDYIFRNTVFHDWEHILNPLSDIYIDAIAKLKGTYREFNGGYYPLRKVKLTGNTYEYISCVPRLEDITKPFRTIKLSDVNVIMIFDSPFDNGTATGLHLEVDKKIRPPFRNVSYEPVKDLSALLDCVKNNHPSSSRVLDTTETFDIMEWIIQGVLPLTATLTTEPPLNSTLVNHHAMWKYFMEELIYEISINVQDPVFVCFGKEAANRCEHINDEKIVLNFDELNIYPMSTHTKLINEIQPLSQINHALIALGKEPVQW
jgi:uracil DNA glycosylase